MNKKLAILGAGGHAKVILDAALLMKQWDEIIFLDDSHNGNKEFMSYPLIGGIRQLGQTVLPKEYDVVIAVGNNHIRAKLYDQAKKLGFHLPCIYHPSASIIRFTDIEEGSVFFAQTVVNAGSKIGKCTIVNTSASVDHDCLLGDFVHISPGANLGGNTNVGDYSWIGIGSCTRHGIDIGSQCMIGAGAVVVKNIPDSTTVVGNPAQVLEKA